MNLVNILLLPDSDLSLDASQTLREAIDKCPLQGRANRLTTLYVNFSYAEGIEIMKLMPISSTPDIGYSLDLKSLPENYKLEYLFGSANNPSSVVIVELDSFGENEKRVKRKYQIYSTSLSKKDI